MLFFDADEVIALFFSIPGQMTDEVHRPAWLHLGGLGAAYPESRDGDIIGCRTFQI